MKASIIFSALVACVVLFCFWAGAGLAKTIALWAVGLFVLAVIVILVFGESLIDWFSNAEERIASGVETGPAPLSDQAGP